MMITIRELIPADAADLLRLQRQLDRETRFMMLEPGERTADETQTAEMLESFRQSDNSILLGAEADGRLVGFVSAKGGGPQRVRHSAYLVAGIASEYTGQGIGTKLFRELEDWACSTGLVRLELTVMTHNERALALYRKCGFGIEGTKRRSLRVDGN
ncbi:GNAT family N-acetyltransferase [Paenibacillus spiritus]|uniref:GNAT family N-acetyltransferase n=1 Tax=Paenibacillus spiritus TaxID=2496557 RepID=UPI00168B3732|nr:GNAT family N-acetyltransferase [Paenibacillus spiritus]